MFNEIRIQLVTPIFWRIQFDLSEKCRVQLYVKLSDGSWKRIQNRTFTREGSPKPENWYNHQSTHKALDKPHLDLIEIKDEWEVLIVIKEVSNDTDDPVNDILDSRTYGISF